MMLNFKTILFFLQLLSFKRIAGSSSERYRLLISDGMYSNSYAMLATQLNKMVTDSTLDEFCVIKVKRLQCNTMQGKKVIIILDMEVLRPGSQVRPLKLFMVLNFIIFVQKLVIIMKCNYLLPLIDCRTTFNIKKCVKSKVIIEKSRGGRFLWNRN